MKWNDLKKCINGIRTGHRFTCDKSFHSRYVSFIHPLTNNCIDQTTYILSSLKKKILMTFFTSYYCVLRIHLLKLLFIVRRFKSLSSPFHSTIDPIQSHIPYTKFFVAHFRSKVRNNIFSKLPSFLPFNPLKISSNRHTPTLWYSNTITTNGLIINNDSQN